MKPNHLLTLFLVLAASLAGYAALGGHGTAERPAGERMEEGRKEVVELTPNPTRNGMVAFQSLADEPLHVYVFDTKGTLLHQLVLREGEKQSLPRLKKGTYPYDVFSGLVGVQRGNILSN